MKIYFAGSIRGGREDAALYARMIDYIKRNHTVLTEHIGNLALSAKEGSRPKSLAEGEDVDRAIYEEDSAWLREADMVIAECTTPSLGVGYEMAYAERFGKPVHIFYDRSRTRLSAMLTGNEFFHIHPYSSEEEIYPELDKILK